MLAKFAEENAEFAHANVELTEELRKKETRLSTVNSTLSSMRTQYEGYQNLIDAIGQTNTIGMELRKQRLLIPDASHYRSRIDKRQEQMNSLRFRLFQLKNERDQLGVTRRLNGPSKSWNPNRPQRINRR